MTAEILHDEDNRTAVLYDADGPVALGPMLSLEEPLEAARVLAMFMEGLDRDASQYNALALLDEWKGFLTAVGQLEPAEPEAPDAPAPGAEPAPAPESSPEPPGGLTPDVSPAASPAGGADGEDPTTLASSPATGEATLTPSTPSADTSMTPSNPCWNCSGTGKVEIAGVEHPCGVCNGVGTLATVS
jgi:hypothetical protein